MTEQKITPFVFEGDTTVRVIERDGSPWFVAADVCRALGLTNAAQAIGPLDPDERGICSTDTPSGQQEVLIVSESGLYTLILRCREAVKSGTVPHRFRRWVTGEVLPALRRIEQAGIPASRIVGNCTFPETMRLRMVKEARQTFGARAAGQLWWTLGLPVVPAMRLGPPQLDLFVLTGR